MTKKIYLSNNFVTDNITTTEQPITSTINNGNKSFILYY